MASLQLEVVTPDLKVVGCEVDYVGVPGVEGEFGVLPGHIPFLSALAIGGLYYKVEGNTHMLFVSGGFAEVSSNKVSVLAESAENVDKINKERAEKARARAQSRLDEAHSGKGDIDVARAELALRRAIVRLNLANV